VDITEAGSVIETEKVGFMRFTFIWRYSFIVPLLSI